MPKGADIRKAFETVLGRDLPTDIGDEVLLRDSVGSYTVVEDALITSRDIDTTGDSSKSCGRISLAFEVKGGSQTAADGTATFSLSDFFCPRTVTFGHPINFVATPRSRIPVFLTSLQRLTASRDDVTVTVFAWDANGDPLGSVAFYWRCFVPAFTFVE
jgi:hypothetical protein